MAVLAVLGHGLSVSAIGMLAAGVLFVYYVTSVFWSYWRLRHVPGPWLAKISDLWYIRAAVSGQVHLRLAEVCSKYGSTVRVGPNTIVTTSEDFIRRANSTRGTYRRSFWFSVFKFDADYENVFSELDEEKHGVMRAKIAAGYSGKDNPNFELSIDRALWDLIHLVETKYTNVAKMDFGIVAQYFTLDSITGIMLNESFGWLRNDEDVHQYIETMEASFPMMNLISVVPALNWLLRRHWVQKLIFPSPEDGSGMGGIKGAAREKISHRFGAEKECKQDMIQSLIRHGCTLQEVADEALLAILAGSDTIATAMRMILLHLLGTPPTFRKLYAECQSTRLPLTSVISHTQALTLPYLQACVREGLRVYPPAAGLTPKVAPPEGDTLDDGTFVPGGTQVGIASRLIYRNKAVYGEDADVFRPERWLEHDEAKVAGMKRHLDLVFGYGRFKCLGMNITMMELPKVIFELVRRFDWAVADPMRPLRYSHCYGLFRQTGMWMRVKKKTDEKS